MVFSEVLPQFICQNLLTVQKTAWENSVPLEILGSQENRLDVGKRFVLLKFDLQKSQVRELGRTANYSIFRS